MERQELQYVSNKYESLLNEMSDQNFDVIRFASYRTACKIRFIQKKTNFHLIDLWNAIESIRENGLHNFVDISSEMSITRLETLISSVFHQLSKRLPQSLTFNLDESVSNLLSWLLNAYDSSRSGKVSVFAIKIAFAILCSGKLIDKLRYIFSLISDPSRGQLIESGLNAFLRESMALPCSVSETATFQYDDSLSSSLFDFSQQIDLNSFMCVFISANSPPLFISWIVILHRMSDVEYVVHSLSCEACNRQTFKGFRYKCQKCFNYNLCQDCFWRGRSSGSHNADTHACKEYTYWKSQTKQIGHSFRKSFRCIPPNKPQLQYTDEPLKEKRFNLTHIVPPSPVPAIHHYNGFNVGSTSSDLESLYGGSNSFYRSPPSTYTTATNDSRFVDDEHRLIARYAQSLANFSKGASVAANPSSSEIINDISQQQRVISQLETKNREIMKEISRLRQEKQENEIRDTRLKSSGYYPSSSVSQQQYDPLLLTELAALRQRKEELESHLSALQESRRELMIQLEGLMKLLKNHGNLLAIPTSGTNSASSTLNRNIGSSLSATTPTSASIQSDISSVSSTANRDLLVAADSVTNAMSSLVKELNSKDETEELINELKNKVIISDNIVNNNNKDIGITDNDIEIEEKLKSRALATSVAFS